jgi:hypothetical protein
MYPSSSDNPPPDDDADERVQQASIRTGLDDPESFFEILINAPGFLIQPQAGFETLK